MSFVSNAVKIPQSKAEINNEAVFFFLFLWLMRVSVCIYKRSKELKQR